MMKAVSVGEGYGRVNLIGEHLDYNGGCVLPLQIKNSIICELSKNREIDCIIKKNRRLGRFYNWVMSILWRKIFNYNQRTVF
jgi:galactokinase